MYADNKKSICTEFALQHDSLEWFQMNTPSVDELTAEFSKVMEDGKPKISGGDQYDIDKYVRLVEQLGYNIDYQNVVNDYGFIAKVTINGKNHAVWQGGIIALDQSILTVLRPLEAFEKK
jgi:hypothetical protein